MTAHPQSEEAGSKHGDNLVARQAAQEPRRSRQERDERMEGVTDEC